MRGKRVVNCLRYVPLTFVKPLPHKFPKVTNLSLSLSLSLSLFEPGDKATTFIYTNVHSTD